MNHIELEKHRLMLKGGISELDKSQQEKIAEIKLYLKDLSEKYNKNLNEFMIAIALFQCESLLSC